MKFQDSDFYAGLTQLVERRLRSCVIAASSLQVRTPVYYRYFYQYHLPLEDCGQVDDAFHSLLLYPVYEEIRENLHRKVTEVGETPWNVANPYKTWRNFSLQSCPYAVDWKKTSLTRHNIRANSFKNPKHLATFKILKQWNQTSHTNLTTEWIPEPAGPWK